MSQASVAIIMGSQSDYDVMRDAETLLCDFGVSFETLIISAHRTPKRLYDFAQSAAGRGFQVIIAGAGGAAHLPGMVAAMTCLPVLGVPVQSKTLKGLDSLLSIVQMPKGVAVGTLAINGAANAALLAVQILALNKPDLAAQVQAFQLAQSQAVADKPHA